MTNAVSVLVCIHSRVTVKFVFVTILCYIITKLLEIFKNHIVFLLQYQYQFNRIMKIHPKGVFP